MAWSQGLCAHTVTGAHSKIATTHRPRCDPLLFVEQSHGFVLPVRLLIGIHTFIAPLESLLKVRIP